MTLTIFTTLLVTTIHCGTPIIFALVGDLIGQRAGHISLSVEGAMLMGCCMSFTTLFYTHNLFLAILAAILAGAIVGFLQVHINIRFGANMFALALALNWLATAVTTYYGTNMVSKSIKDFAFQQINIPVLCKIPVVGAVLFQNDILTYISFLLPAAAYFFLFKTRLGTAVRAAGEVHQVAVAYGYNVKALKYGAVIFACILAGIGGAYLACSYTLAWSPNMSSGRGFIASSLVILCSWKPLRAYFGAYLFGLAQALVIITQLLAVPISPQLIGMLPYVIVVIALAFISLNRNPTMPNELTKIGRPLEILN